MKESEEMKLHRKMQKIEGKYEVKTDWGKIVMTLEAIPNYAGGKGCPDEILSVKIEIDYLGTIIRLLAPVLIEEGKAGYSDAIADLDKFCKRSLSGEQKSYLGIPMIAIGGDNYRKLKGIEKQLTARFDMTQVPKRVIE